MIKQIVTRRSLFGWPLLGLWPRSQTDNKFGDNSREVFSEWLKSKKDWHISYHDIILSGKIRRYQWISCCDNVWFERTDFGAKPAYVLLPNRAVPSVVIFWPCIKSFPAFYDYDNIGIGHLMEWLEAERFTQNLSKPFIYVLRPKNRPDLIGAKISAVEQNILTYHIVKEDKSNKIEIKLNEIFPHTKVEK